MLLSTRTPVVLLSTRTPVVLLSTRTPVVLLSTRTPVVLLSARTPVVLLSQVRKSLIGDRGKNVWNTSISGTKRKRAVTIIFLKRRQLGICIYDAFYDFGVKRHFQRYFSYIVAISFIGGGNRSTLEKTTALGQGTDKLYNKCFLYTKAPVTR